MQLDFKRGDFPDGFLFGTATSAYQIEGASFGGAGLCQWDIFAQTPGNVVRGENGAVACDHYHRWEADLDLVRDAGLDSYRFSTSWARVMPDGKTVNPEGLDFYDRLVDGMLERGIKPMATLYHWEMPAALQDLGGWRNRDVADWFADFTTHVMTRIGDRMHTVAPVNEPWCVAWLSHFMGHHAPGLRDIRAATRAMHHVLLAHGKSTQAMRALGMTGLGAVMNHEYAQPVDDTEEAARLARIYDGIYNRWFLGGVFRKEYPADIIEHLGPHMPHGWQDDFDTIAQPLDWVGINYYTRKLIGPDGSDLFPYLEEREGPLEKTAMDWEIYPDGLHHFIHHTGQYTDLPIYITENGLASYDRVEDGRVMDAQRIRYLNSHVAAVKRAMDEGANVAGYTIWSLLDNYEWALGYDKRFGLVHVDFDSLERTPKQSWHALKTALAH
ncbi:beta-glucosidase [Rubricella aquisinus]|uniref:Beta-glucosidase n=1 Tax=Rubricella aquisinus TaxID=2028108 RepID=A0A840X1J5_9RHOB|nr:GH1 family beta-glucosidase [Rubricella aquisinus]MBB5516634.1 beta-glucosidase [Rubricella aquisinus]